MIKAEIRELAERVLRSELGSLGLDRIDVREDRDYADDPALFVDAFLKAGSPPVAGEVSTRVHHALSRKLLEAGEDRFPYLRCVIPTMKSPRAPLHWRCTECTPNSCKSPSNSLTARPDARDTSPGAEPYPQPTTRCFMPWLSSAPDSSWGHGGLGSLFGMSIALSITQAREKFSATCVEAASSATTPSLRARFFASFSSCGMRRIMTPGIGSAETRPCD